MSNIVFANDRVGWIISGLREISKTTDGGATWSKLNINLTEDQTNLVALWFIDEINGWATGAINRRPTIWETHDGGLSWRVQYDLERVSEQAHGGILDIRFVDSSHGWAVGFNDFNAVILSTSDGGTHWKTQYSGREITQQFNSVRFWDLLNGWVLCPQGLMQTEDGGESWSLRYFELPSFTDMEVVGPSEVWLAGSVGHLIHTSDGLSWTDVSLEPLVGNAFVVSVKFANKDLGWASGVHGEIVVTRDGGKSWVRESIPLTREASEEITIGKMVTTTSNLFVITQPDHILVRPLR